MAGLVVGMRAAACMLLLLAAQFSRQCQSETIEYDFVVERTIVNMDGVVRDALTINQQVIGPTVEATVGDTLLISVTNRCIMQEVVSMHWHGISQKGTPWADGAAFVTNCPITHGSSYTYNFTVDTPGTYWYHVHVGSMREEGVNGMIVVYSEPSSDINALVQTPTKFGSFAYDDEIHVVLNDRFSPSVYLLNTMINNNPFMKVGKGDTIYINGKGESKYCSYNGTTTTVTTTSSDGVSSTVTTSCKGQREVFALNRNKTYLVRVVNAAFLAFFNLAIAGHYFTIVGVDGGTYTHPVDIDSIDLSAGQRVMALLRFNQSAVDASHSDSTDNFLVRAQTDWGGIDNTHGGIVYAYLTYGDPVHIHSNNVSPLVPPNESRNWHEWYDLVTPHESVPNGCPADHEVTKRFQVDGKIQYTDVSTGTGLTPPSISPGVANTRESWTMYNNSRFMAPATPYLLTSYLNHRNHTMTFNGPHNNPNRRPPVTPKSKRLSRDTTSSASAMVQMPAMDPALRPLRVELGDVVEVVVQAYASASGGCDLHPWHLHGHSFWLVSRGDGLYNATSGRGGGAAAATTFTSAHPLLQDTVSGYPSRYGDSRTGKTHGVWNDPCGWFTIRFRADNPGMWLFHCHIGWHMEMGMALVFDESSELVPPPPSDYGMCGVAGEMESFNAFARDARPGETGGDGPVPGPPHPHNDNMKHGSTFSVLVSFVVVLGLVAIVALFGLWMSRRHVHGMFMQINPHAKDIDEIGNPLSQHALQTHSAHSAHSHSASSSQDNYASLNNPNTTRQPINKNDVVFNPDGEDDLEEISFGNHSNIAQTHSSATHKGSSFHSLMMGEDV